GKGFDPFVRRVRHVKRADNLGVQGNTNTTVYADSKSQYHVQVHYEGESFFNDWYFFDGNDPTHGLINYQSRDQAVAKKLAYVDDATGMTVLTVDSKSTVPVGGKRDSVRVSTKQTWDRGLFIADFAFMPHGCSVWPAYWSVGPHWPMAGEIDILEGVHNQPKNQYTLHTGIPCDLPSDGKGIDATGGLIWHDCQTYPTDNRGCGFSDPSDVSYGAGFNNAGGGVLAHEWNSDHVRVWFFPRSKIPDDISAKKPNPSSWGQPVAAWDSQYCNIDKALYQHSLVLDIALCGDWAGPAYAQSGCPGTCEQAAADPSNLVDAKWGINYITVFQS
ncbi:putative glycosidase C21B10.07, partial [Leucoagaricus sp. SymC.cos]